MEKPVIFFWQETKCGTETMKEIGRKVWKVCKTVTVDAQGTAGGLAFYGIRKK